MMLVTSIGVPYSRCSFLLLTACTLLTLIPSSRVTEMFFHCSLCCCLYIIIGSSQYDRMCVNTPLGRWVACVVFWRLLVAGIFGCLGLVEKVG